MDPLSVAASAAGLAALAGTLYKSIGQLLVGVSAVDESVRNFQDTISGLETVLYELEATFSLRPRGNAFATRQHASIQKLLASCQSYLFSLKKRIPRGPGEGSHLQRAYTQLKFGLQTPLMTSIQSHIQSHTQMLQISLSGVVVAGQWQSKSSENQTLAGIHRICRQVEEINSKLEQRKRSPEVAFWAADADKRLEDQREYHQLQEIADRNTKEWIYSARSVTEEMSECEFDRSSVASELPQDPGERDSEGSDWDPEPEKENSLPLDMTTRLIEKLELTAKNKMKTGKMYGSAEDDQRRAIRLLEQRERVHKMPFQNRSDMEETLAEILTQRGTTNSLEEAKKTLQQHLQDEKEPSARKWRLCHLLAKVYLQQGKLSQAEKFANRALAGRKELQGSQALVNESARLAKAVFQRKGDFASAAVVSECIELEGEYPTPVTCRGPPTLSRAMTSEVEFYRWLKECGYEVDGADGNPLGGFDAATGRKLIHRAITTERIDITEHILREFSFTLELRDANGATPLLLAAVKKNSLLVQEILRHDPDVLAIDDSGDTALHSVQSSKGGVKAAEVLLNHWTPVKIDASNHEGKTALHLAVGLGNIKMVEALLVKGANMNARTTTQRTPLHIAVETKRDEAMIKLLLAKGAYFNAMDTELLTPLQLAKQMRRNKDPLPQRSMSVLEQAIKNPRTMMMEHHEPMQSSSSLNRNVTSSSKSSVDHTGYVMVQNPKYEPSSAQELYELPEKYE